MKHDVVVRVRHIGVVLLGRHLRFDREVAARFVGPGLFGFGHDNYFKF